MRRLVRLAAVIVTLVAALNASADTSADFIRRHWRQPLAPQGTPPARYTPIEASLEPESCGTCHPTQFADWKTTVHSRAMGPGVAGQLVEMRENDPESALVCYTCHAPLAEQAPLVKRDAGAEANPVYEPALHERGVVCAACHVRHHERFGPPRRDGALASAAPRESLPHNGVTRTPAFLSSEFCRGCHQFTPDGYKLNGKLLEDTYNEWKTSRFARAGVQCQNCHMPDRRHLWRGIHDAEMVRSGLTITVTVDTPRRRPTDAFGATLKVQNSGVGHAFPTYVTPRVVMRGELIDAAGMVLDGSRLDRVIERNIELDLSREVSDTRLRPNQSIALRYRRTIERPGLRARFSVIVEPDAFYTRFFEALLQQGAGRGTAQIREALAETRRSPFTVFVQDVAVD
jgi:hypothetical protein